MSFDPNIPTVNDDILQSFFQLRANFQAINSSYADNHVGLTEDENQGMHNYLLYKDQAVDPTTSADQVAFYNKIVSSIPQLFYMPNNAQTPIQMTSEWVKTDSSNTQYSFMAGPFVVYGGLVSNPTQGQTVTLTPNKTLRYVDLTVVNSSLTGNSGGVMAIPTSIAANSFNISYQPTTSTFNVYYFAIGN